MGNDPGRRAGGPYRGRAALGLILLLALFTGPAGCAHLFEVNPAQAPAVYRPGEGGDELVHRHAPVFLIHGAENQDNLIGSPRARYGGQDWEEVWVDPEQPALYYRVDYFEPPRGRYTNLYYRVHFPASPWSLVPFNLGAGRNMGMLVVVTLDGEGHPVLVTNSLTCGCYVALIPTDYTPEEALPEGWTGQAQEIYGETLPGMLKLKDLEDPVLVVTVRPGEHRVMGIAAAGNRETACLGGLAMEAPLAPMDDLYQVPLEEGGTISLFYETGPLAGHVKGAWKPWETLFLGLLSMDLVVGMDKAYGHPENPFYTSIKPWNRQVSDMNDFPGFLKFHGWRF